MLYAWRIFLAFVIVLIGLYAWATLQPSHGNWGIHSLAFYELPIRILSLIIALAIILPAGYNGFIRFIDAGARALRHRNPHVIMGIGITASVALWMLFPVQLHLLGDGAILLRSIPRSAVSQGLPDNFRNQPLVYVVYRGIEALLGVFMNPDAHDVYYAIDLIGGVLFMTLIFWSMKFIQRPAGEKILLGSLLLFGGGYQFFFGYVENYVLQYVVTAAYALTGWFALEKKLPLWAPVLLFILMTGLHLGSLIFFPSALYLLLARKVGKGGHNRKRIFLGGGAALVILFGVLFAIGFNIVAFVKHFLDNSADFLPILPVRSEFFAYSMFSPRHLLDWCNACLHIAPFAVVLAIIAFLEQPQDRWWKTPSGIFLLWASGLGMLFTWIINSALGLARDWDLLSSFFVPLMVLTLYQFSLPGSDSRRKPILTIATVLTLLHLVLRIGINASAEKHLARMEMLNSTALLSMASFITYEEALANYYYDGGEYDKARRAYEIYLQSGALNPRILANMSDCYRRLNRDEDYFQMLKKTADHGSKNPGVYSNLAVEYAQRHDTLRAVAFNLRCLAIDSTQPQAYANLSLLYLNSGNAEECINAARRAIDYGFSNPLIYRIMGKAFIRLNQIDEAIRQYDRYLEAQPGDTVILDQRRRLEEFLKRRGASR